MTSIIELNPTQNNKSKLNFNKEKTDVKYDSYPEPSDLIISTCTVVSSISDELDLNLFSRTLPVHDINSDMMEKKEGGIYNITLLSDYSRGKNDKKTKIKEFNNQVTINYKYWGFRTANIKIFTNGKLQMTGIKYAKEAEMITNVIINYIKKMEIRIYLDQDLVNKENEQPETDENKYKSTIYWIYNYNKNDIIYKRKNNNYITELINFNQLDYKDNYLFIDSELNSLISLSEKKFNYLKSKRYLIDEILKDISNCIYNNTRKKVLTEEDNIKFDNISIQELTTNIEIDDNLLLEKILLVMSNQENEKIIQGAEHIIDILIKYINLLYIKINIKHNKKLNLLNIEDNVYSTFYDNLSTVIDNYENKLVKTIKKIKKVKEEDNNICNQFTASISPKIKKTITDKLRLGLLNQGQIDEEIPYINYNYIQDINNNRRNYKLGEIKTELINSDYYTKFNIDLSSLSKIIKKKYKIYNTYDPDEYPGVLVRFYYNEKNTVQGQCHCDVHCSIAEKKSICCKITVSIFRPGSIIITGAKNIKQLNNTYEFINKVLKENFQSIKGILDDESKNNPNINNIRKISRKPRLFYIKKSNIVY